ncbi:hypothetical protein M9H77_11986 [Catharanthus roseus]|uniref:Uncharacterized protein n=1 Tax=Catharanthus roseus TaxID=4058 RepID=A0ACC0BGA6_CATRO|nr:hypothetical protein M9H77_11986 [Catharanthus roseus]
MKDETRQGMKMFILQRILIKCLKCLTNIYKKSDIEICVFSSMKKLYNLFCTLISENGGAPSEWRSMPNDMELMYEVGIGLRRGHACGFSITELARL